LRSLKIILNNFIYEYIDIKWYYWNERVNAHRLKSFLRMKRVQIPESCNISVYLCNLRGPQKKKKNNDEYWIFASFAGFFPRYAYQALFLFFANFGFCRSTRLPLSRLFDFGNSRAVSFWRVSQAQSQHRRRIARQLADPSARRSLIVVAAKLETAGTRSRWLGLTSCAYRI